MNVTRARGLGLLNAACGVRYGCAVWGVQCVGYGVCGAWGVRCVESGVGFAARGVWSVESRHPCINLNPELVPQTPPLNLTPPSWCLTPLTPSAPPNTPSSSALPCYPSLSHTKPLPVPYQTPPCSIPNRSTPCLTSGATYPGVPQNV
eukprot:365092-Chlamydomonas_euryale.AAC.7